ncbi:MAG: formylmethanofuran dehydrogenase subunit C [Planctomycetes bacterium]|nr:formylmethanofuran dehydrogenase subunit C [Planctomycetota bacterium]
MSGYTLTWKPHGPPALADGAALRPDVLGALAPDALRAVALKVGRDSVPLGDLFDVSGESGPTLTLRGVPPLPRMGAKMVSGELIIEGNTGDDLGASMRGGVIRVRGRAGHRVGGPDYTSDRGMTGGEIVVSGDAGDYAGLRMRRGLIAIGGAAARSPGFRMLAGTVVVARGALDSPGLEMQRGTVVALDSSVTPARHAWFQCEGEFPLTSMPAALLLVRRLAELKATNGSVAANAVVNLSSGDRFGLGKGELWQIRS